MSSIDDLIAEGEKLIELQKYEDAMTPYSSAKEMASLSGDTVKFIQCCQRMGTILDNLNRSLDAVAELDLAINAASLDVLVSAQLLITKGYCLVRAGKFREAERAFLLSIKTIERVPPRMRTGEMHEVNDLAYNNLYLTRDLLKAQAAGKEIKLITE